MTEPIPILHSLDVVQLWSLVVAFERRLAAELEELGVSVAAFRLIGEVMAEPDGIRQNELARRLGVRPPTVSAAVAALELRGLLTRERDPNDPRARRVRLAPNAPLRAGFDVLSRMNTAAFSGLTNQERKETVALIVQLTANLEAAQ